MNTFNFCIQPIESIASMFLLLQTKLEYPEFSHDGMTQDPGMTTLALVWGTVLGLWTADTLQFNPHLKLHNNTQLLLLEVKTMWILLSIICKKKKKCNIFYTRVWPPLPPLFSGKCITKIQKKKIRLFKCNIKPF